MNSYRIYTPISSVLCGLACFEHFYRFQVTNPKPMSRSLPWGLANQWSYKEGLKAPNTSIPWQIPRDKKIREENGKGKLEGGPRWPPQLEHGGDHGPWGSLRSDCGSPALLCCGVFRAAIHFSCDCNACSLYFRA